MIETAQILIQESLKDQKMLYAQDRRNAIYKLLDYYAGDNTAQYIEDRFSADAFREIPVSEFNVTRRMIDRMSRIYTLGATRNVNKTYDSMTMKKPHKMKHMEKMTRLIGTIATQVVFKQYPEPHFNYNPVYYFDAYFDQDPFVPYAITYPMVQNVHDVSDTKKLNYCYWDDKQYLIYDEDGNIIFEQVHNYGIIPFVFTHREHHLNEFFVTGAYDICAANEQINILLTEAALGMRFQMFGQYVIEGMYEEEKIMRAGSSEIMVIPEPAKMDIKSPQANVRDAIDLVKAILDLTAQNNHLWITFAEDGKSDRPSSGIALKIKDLERFEDYQDDVELWELYERELYSVEKVIAEANGIKLPEEMGLRFNEPDYPMSAQDQIAVDTFMLSNNLITQKDLMLKYNKHLTEGEAEKLVNENKEANAEGQGTEGEERSVFNRLLNQTPAS
tara:strand:+ start:14360 stop:15694 length:1335 start_codon:yes stop_codon:yes gene_type:complete